MNREESYKIERRSYLGKNLSIYYAIKEGETEKKYAHINDEKRLASERKRLSNLVLKLMKENGYSEEEAISEVYKENKNNEVFAKEKAPNLEQSLGNWVKGFNKNNKNLFDDGMER